MPLQTMLHESSIRVIDYRCTAAPGDVSFPEVHRLDSLSYVRKGSFGCRVRGERDELGARLVTFGNGRVVREWIVDVDDSRRRVAWSVQDEPFKHHNASARVFEIAPDRCRFVWIADVLPDELCGFVTGMIEQGLGVIQSTLEKDLRAG